MEIPTLVSAAIAYKNSPSSIDLEENSDVISNLKFIGQIQEGEKINIRTREKFVQPTGWATSFSRTFLWQDSKNNAYNFINHTISRAIDIFNLHITSKKASNIVYCINIVNDLEYAITGIRNLKKTYSDYTYFVGQLQSVLQSIESKLADLKTKLPRTISVENRDEDELDTF